jgi:hypothetical protein
MLKNPMTWGVAAVLVCVGMTSPALALGWQTIGSLTDPCNGAIPGYLDITQAWVEKNGTQLKFVMIVEGTIPSSTPAPGDDIIFLWFVDADNNLNTGQGPGSVGSEFNVRSWVGHDGIGGYVDVTGSWVGTGGAALTTITGNKVEIVVDMPQIMSPDLFHFRCGSFQIFGGEYSPGNEITEESSQCWASKYAVLMDPDNVQFGVESNMQIYKCDPCDPLNTATATLVIDKHTANTEGSIPVFDAMEGHDDGDTPGTHQLFGQTMGVCDFLHVRTEAIMDISTVDAGAFGQVDTQAAGHQGFRLLGRDGDTGPVPHGMFILDLRHGYHVRGIEASWKVDAQSYAQIVINDINDRPWFQVKVWGDGRGGDNTPYTGQKVDSIDLADIGMEFNRRYDVASLVVNTCRINDPSYATYQAQAAGHSDLVVTFRMVHPTADLNADRTVDFKDMAVLAAQWLTQK